MQTSTFKESTHHQCLCRTTCSSLLLFSCGLHCLHNSKLCLALPRRCWALTFKLNACVLPKWKFCCVLCAGRSTERHAS